MRSNIINIITNFSNDFHCIQGSSGMFLITMIVTKPLIKLIIQHFTIVLEISSHASQRTNLIHEYQTLSVISFINNATRQTTSIVTHISNKIVFHAIKHFKQTTHKLISTKIHFSHFLLIEYTIESSNSKILN